MYSYTVIYPFLSPMGSCGTCVLCGHSSSKCLWPCLIQHWGSCRCRWGRVLLVASPGIDRTKALMATPVGVGRVQGASHCRCCSRWLGVWRAAFWSLGLCLLGVGFRVCFWRPGHRKQGPPAWNSDFHLSNCSQSQGFGGHKYRKLFQLKNITIHPIQLLLNWVTEYAFTVFQLLHKSVNMLSVIS